MSCGEAILSCANVPICSSLAIILSKANMNNPIILGKADIGKVAIIEVGPLHLRFSNFLIVIDMVMHEKRILSLRFFTRCNARVCLLIQT